MNLIFTNFHKRQWLSFDWNVRFTIYLRLRINCEKSKEWTLKNRTNALNTHRVPLATQTLPAYRTMVSRETLFMLTLMVSCLWYKNLEIYLQISPAARVISHALLLSAHRSCFGLFHVMCSRIFSPNFSAITSCIDLCGLALALRPSYSGSYQVLISVVNIIIRTVCDACLKSDSKFLIFSTTSKIEVYNF